MPMTNAEHERKLKAPAVGNASRISPRKRCRVYETPTDWGRELGACAKDLRVVGPVRRLVAYRKHIKRQLARCDLVCVTIPERACCAR